MNAPSAEFKPTSNGERLALGHEATEGPAAHGARLALDRVG
jgi:hypothetical protein